MTECLVLEFLHKKVNSNQVVIIALSRSFTMQYAQMRRDLQERSNTGG